MASFTAQILIGNGGGYDNEGIIPDSTLFLSENSRPAWVLKYRGRKITWIPTLDNMLEDGLLMLAIFVLKDPELVELAQEYFHNKEVNKAILYDDITEEYRQVLYQKSRSMAWKCKLIISVFNQSYIHPQLSVLNDYPMNLEVCVPIFTRIHSRWDKQLRITGSINSII